MCYASGGRLVKSSKLSSFAASRPATLSPRWEVTVVALPMRRAVVWAVGGSRTGAPRQLGEYQAQTPRGQRDTSARDMDDGYHTAQPKSSKVYSNGSKKRKWGRKSAVANREEEACAKGPLMFGGCGAPDCWSVPHTIAKWGEWAGVLVGGLWSVVCVLECVCGMFEFGVRVSFRWRVRWDRRGGGVLRWPSAIVSGSKHLPEGAAPSQWGRRISVTGYE